MAQQDVGPDVARPPAAEDSNRGFQLAVLSMAAAALATVIDYAGKPDESIYEFTNSTLFCLREAKALCQAERSRLNVAAG